MFPHQRRDLATGNNFTFSNSLPKENTGLSHSDELEYDTWAARIKDQYNYFGKPSDVKPGAWTRRSPRNKSYSNPDEGEFKWVAKAEGDDDKSSTPSPELWKKAESPLIHSAETSPVRSHGYYNNRDSRYSHISHSARAQTIAKYRQEMLDLVRGMPETAYELSLRDIVESPKITTPLQETKEEDNKPVEGKNGDKKKKEKEKRGAKTMSRSESMDTVGGPLLKMFIPRIPDVLRRRKSTDIKVSPKPSLGDGERSGSEKSIDREWWSAEFEPMNSSSGSSTSNDSSGSRRRNRKLRGCYPFFQTR